MKMEDKTKLYCKSLFKYIRRKTVEVRVGDIVIGGNNPVVIQTMVTTPTSDIEATVAECKKVADAGAQLVRITAPTVKDAEALGVIRQKLRDDGYSIPLAADIHFNPDAAEVAAKNVEKIRINPGNFTDKQAVLSDYTDSGTWDEDVNKLRTKFIALLDVCKQYNTALRIGANHGSLSSRIMLKYGDTPEGMVESAMEFLRICKEVGFQNVVVSMKSSNTRVMVHAYRLLITAMDAEDMHYPLHLGVTEAGDAEDGRVKSAVGIGTLLADGLGDTIRVSLTEPAENEIPVAKNLLEYFKGREKHQPIEEFEVDNFNPYEYSKEKSHANNRVGGNNPVVVVSDLSALNPVYPKDIESLGYNVTYDKGFEPSVDTAPDYIYTASSSIMFDDKGLNIIDDNSDDFIFCNYNMLSGSFIEWLRENRDKVLVLTTDNLNGVAEQRAFFLKLKKNKIANPVIISRTYNESNFEKLQLMASSDFGALLIDGFGAGIMMSANADIPAKNISDLCFRILQASRVRYTRIEYIACPGCGRTLFDLRETLKKVKDATAELKGLKIGIMGCIVNGPGEMADADYGYVGAGPGKITLYKGKEPVKKNIPQENAIKELISLIKGDM